MTLEGGNTCCLPQCDGCEKERKDDIRFLLSFLSIWATEVPEGMDPTFYQTLTYEGDLKIKERIDKIKAKYDIRD